MSANVTVTVSRNRFPSIGASLDDKINDALDAAVATCIEVADPLTRVDSGALRNNKTIERGNYSRTLTWNQDYALNQNSGTVHMAGTNFADKGADAAMPVLVEGLEGAFT